MHVIFVTGGVVSSLGKGIVASIAGGLLGLRGFKVQIKKIDPYLNVDTGTLSPIEHGEVFVTNDGAETDLDLGHYERLGFVKTLKTDYITSGSVYYDILTKERKGEFLGKTIQVIPHVTGEFQDKIFENTDCDILICEIGGTVGDIESVPILEAARQIRQTYEKGKVLFIHVALMPYLKKAQEWKTKPVQHSIRTLLSFGIEPSLLLCRMEEENTENWKEKIFTLSNVKKENIFSALDADSIYHAFLNYEKEGIANAILRCLNEKEKKPLDLSFIQNYVHKLNDDSLQKIKIGIVGKYIALKDSYKSLEEALNHAAISLNAKILIEWIDSENLNLNDLNKLDGILIPGGFGNRGIEGKIQAINYAKIKNKPFLGICLGMQLALIEGLKELLEDASSTEFGNCKNPVIAKMSEWMSESEIFVPKDEMGGTMRVGSYFCDVKPNTKAFEIYKTEQIAERHRHRYEFNNNYINYLKDAGITVSGSCNGLVEIIENSDLKFFVAVQFHPEFNSNIKSPNPLFVEFLRSCI